MSEKLPNILPRARAFALFGAILLGSTTCTPDTQPDSSIAPTTLIPKPVDSLSTTTTIVDAEPAEIQRVEDTYGVDIRTTRDNLRDQEKSINDVPPQSEIALSPSSWSKDQLALLDRALSRIPKSFYAPKSNNKLGIVISDHTGTCCGSNFLEGFSPNQVAVSKTFFDIKDPNDALSHVAHELTHRKDPRDYPDPSKPPVQANDSHGRGGNISLWDPILNKYLGTSYEKLFGSEQLLDNFTAIVKSTDSNNRIEERWVQHVSYAFYHTDGKHPSEFIAIGSEFYLRGREDFVNRFGKLLKGVVDDQAAERLYNFYRDTVFDGQEYQDYKPL